MKRAYLKEEPIFQYKGKKGTPFACKIFAENTTLTVNERLQGEYKYDGEKGFKIIYTINFQDTGLSCTSKVKGRCYQDNEGLYACYALDLMEDNTFEEYYKAALLITKNRIKRSMEQFEKAENDFKKNGFWSYPYNGNVTFYRRSYNLEKRTYKTIDITEKDLKYIKSFK